ncbi:MAG: amidohydrolase family protein [Flavobacteriaceae bacterium]|nr:amidohydrolase family protein [Flavobacteriaceae bacterium]
MKIIDSHQHFWAYDPQLYDWIDDSMEVLKRDFLPNDLKLIYQENNVDGCIAVQARTDFEEIDFLLHISHNHQFVKGVVGWLDFQHENFEEKLEFYVQQPQLKGLRHVVQAEPIGFLDKKKFRNRLSWLEQYNLVYDILIFPPQLEESIRLVKDFPNQIFVLDHIAKPYIKSGEIKQWEKDMRTLAQHDNIFCKVSGMVTEADWKQWSYKDLRPYLDVVTSSFGSHRLLYGSDWPVCLLAAKYQEVIETPMKYFAKFTLNERCDIFGKNASKVYQLD